jgi:D-tyrosyl-tRNA(Tyr) deacylase
MRAVVQRVTRASVTVSGEVVAAVDGGLLVYLGVAPEDGEDDSRYLADKVRHLRIFADDKGLMNRDVVQAGGEVLTVSAFTVHCDARKGRRPSFDTAAGAELAEKLYDLFCLSLSAGGVKVHKGAFREYMHVDSTNDGPICVLLDSRRLF